MKRFGIGLLWAVAGYMIAAVESFAHSQKALKGSS
jgi:hypothetical protein